MQLSVNAFTVLLCKLEHVNFTTNSYCIMHHMMHTLLIFLNFGATGKRLKFVESNAAFLLTADRRLRHMEQLGLSLKVDGWQID
jgi:hypothetical protein